MKNFNVRFPNESIYQPIPLDIKYVSNTRIYDRDVFFDYQGITLSMKKLDWDKLQLSNNINK